MNDESNVKFAVECSMNRIRKIVERLPNEAGSDRLRLDEQIAREQIYLESYFIGYVDGRLESN